jgi:hypothetical protein
MKRQCGIALPCRERIGRCESRVGQSFLIPAKGVAKLLARAMLSEKKLGARAMTVDSGVLVILGRLDLCIWPEVWGGRGQTKSLIRGFKTPGWI